MTDRREPRTDTREYLRANLFDGDEGGDVTLHVSTWLGELTTVVDELLAEAAAPREAPDQRLREALEQIAGSRHAADHHSAVIARAALATEGEPTTREHRPEITEGLQAAQQRLSYSGLHDGRCPEPDKPCTCGIDAAIFGTNAPPVNSTWARLKAEWRSETVDLVRRLVAAAERMQGKEPALAWLVAEFEQWVVGAALATEGEPTAPQGPDDEKAETFRRGYDAGFAEGYRLGFNDGDWPPSRPYPETPEPYPQTVADQVQALRIDGWAAPESREAGT